VNALCVGLMSHGDLRPRPRAAWGNKVVLFGSRTGPDGVGGASVLASSAFGRSRTKSTVFGGCRREGLEEASVQVRRPLPREAPRRVAASSSTRNDLIEGIQDLGAAGIACATTELAAGGDGGMHVDLDAIRSAIRA